MAPRLFGILILLVALPLLGCSDNDEPPTVEEKVVFCRDLRNVEASLAKVREDAVAALLPANQAAFQNTVQSARADMDALASSATELEGGSDAVAELRLDVQTFRATLATPDIAAVLPQLQRQAEEIQRDLAAIGAENQCP
jgi:hypothetical protein